MRAEFSTFNTGGSLLSTPKAADSNKRVFPDELGFDHMQSYFIGVEGNPTSNMRAEVNFNIVGNVAENPIDEIFYENRARIVSVLNNSGRIDLSDVNRVQIYTAEFDWVAKDFDARAFYRTGHYHWGYEGDFFGLYPEANYGPNLDIYNGEILGIELDGKKAFKGFKAAFGPQLWWGANPAVLLKYRKEIGKYHVTGIFHEDVDELSDALTSIAIPLPKTRRAAIHIEREFGPFELQVGGIWGGQPLNGREFQIAKGEEGNYTVFSDEIKGADNWGGKFKITYSKGVFNWYAQTAALGLVANGSADGTQTFTGWRLKDSGSGNQTNFLTGFTFNVGDLQIAPNFLWQKPIVAAMPNGIEAPGRLRNVQDDPFAVRGNRETVAGEILLTYDPTPGTWMYAWDNDMVEDAKFAFNLGFVYRDLSTAQDGAIGFLGNRTAFAFAGSAPAHDLWEVHSRIVSKINPEFGIIANLYGGNAQANGSDARLLHRYGGDIRLIHKKMKLTTMLKIDDWGPFDYHRDFNLTYPLQITADLSTSISNAAFLNMTDTRMGLRFTWRSLNEYSPRYCPTTTLDGSGLSICPTDPVELKGFDNGREWEIRTYLKINIGK